MSNRLTWWTAFILLLMGISTPIALALKHRDSPPPEFFTHVQIGLSFMAICVAVVLIIIYLTSRRSDAVD